MVLPLPVRTHFTAPLVQTLAALFAPWLSSTGRYRSPGLWPGFLACCLACCLPPTIGKAETVLLDFSSPTCGPCQAMRPIVARLVADGLPVREIDITREPQLAARYRITQVPTFLVVVDGNPVDQVVGSTTYQQLHQMLRRAMPAAPPQQAVMPIGQSPRQFATTSSLSSSPAVVATSGNGYPAPTTRPPLTNLQEPQSGRLVSLPESAARPSSPQASANPFLRRPSGNAPSRLISASVGSPSIAHQRLLAATVKITVEDAQGKSAGTGTIVDARSGEALILTCGHIFRSSNGKGPITVTTFRIGAQGATPGAAYSGHLIDFDLERDLALVSMRPTAPVAAVSIAVVPLDPGAAVTSVGCNHGQNPTPIDSHVTTNNRYQGPPNVEVAGAPVEGRSGGGLFNAQGELTGVCFAADPAANEGLYASVPSIHAKLDSLQLTMVYQPSQTRPQGVPAALPPALRSPPAPQMAVRGQEPEPPIASMNSLSVNPAATTLSVAEQAAFAEIQRRGANSEVICIIRPQAPGGKSEVITLSNVSPEFVRALAHPAASSAGSEPRQFPAVAATDRLGL